MYMWGRGGGGALAQPADWMLDTAFEIRWCSCLSTKDNTIYYIYYLHFSNGASLLCTMLHFISTATESVSEVIRSYTEDYATHPPS